MNTYSVQTLLSSSTNGKFGGIFGSNGGATRTNDLKDLLRILGYASVFGKNLQFIQDEAITIKSGGSELIVVPRLGFRFDSPISFSNIEPASNSTLKMLVNTIYDTNCQSVNDFTDKPYPVKGYLAVACPIVDFSAGSLSGSPTADMDAYVKLNFTAVNGSGTPFTIPIYIGTCNSSLQEAYTPFSTCMALIFNPSEIGMNASQALSNIAVTNQISRAGALSAARRIAM